MKNNEPCIHGGISPISLLEDLHQSQGGSGRHRCPTCSYEQGFYLGSSGKWEGYGSYCASLVDAETCQMGSIAPTHILVNLGENQGGPGRHKCTNCAFKQGFEVGMLKQGTQKISIEQVAVPKSSNHQGNTTPTVFHIDYIEQEMRNKHLGLLGELFVLKSEIAFLRANGKEELSAKVEHVSVEIGDGLGYDILSFDLLGNEKKIEVKTTRGDSSRPFYLTKNELEVSAKNTNCYYVYRLFDFDPNVNKGKYYVIEGDIAKQLTLDPTVYLAYPASTENN